MATGAGICREIRQLTAFRLLHLAPFIDTDSFSKVEAGIPEGIERYELGMFLMSQPLRGIPSTRTGGQPVLARITNL